MPKVNKIKCWLEDGDTGERVREYQRRVKNEKSASAIVIPEEGQTFTINISPFPKKAGFNISFGGEAVNNA
jgi:hypothetical protein